MNVPTHYKARPYQLFSFKTQSADRTVKPITQTYDIQFEFMPYCWYDLHLPWDLNFRTVLKMRRIHSLAFVWTLITMKIGFVFSDIHFLERHEGESVVLSCVVEQRNPSPFGVYLKRSWLRPSQVLFMHTKSEFTAGENDKNRTSVSGDPSNHSLNVTISQLRVSDTDRYHCEFVADNPFSEDIRIQGKTEFFLLVKADAPGSMDIELVETCTGGSAVLPCLPPQGERSAVEGVILKRQRGQATVEVLYQLKHQSPPSSSSHFSVERVQLSLVPGPGGITYSITLQQLQPDDSALYSCQLLMYGRPNSFSSLGRRVFFISVQGDHCSCSTYSTLLYGLFSAVAILILLLLFGLVVIYKGKARHSVKSQHQAPIYEEMVGVHPHRRKVAPNHLEEMETSEYRNCQVKKSCLENHYEIPSGALSPQIESQK
ncbi:cd7 antigen-like isoform X2 [Channa argus]|uniref:cd7 antigen-like isoform X2 n=1 Tax=Channa argus TaxID=215402 RepID=UPI003521D3D9